MWTRFLEEAKPSKTITLMEKEIETPPPLACYKHTAGEDQNQYVRIADRISNHDLNFLALLDAENGKWDPERIGVTNDRGICQISPYYHSEITNDARFGDPVWQIEQCWKLYKGGTTFYGKKNIHKTIKNFTCQ